MAPRDLISLERKDLIKAGITLRDENERLRAEAIDTKQRLDHAIRTLHYTEDKLRFYRRLSFTVAAALVVFMLAVYLHGVLP